jgi:hypothetical protein
VLDTRVPDGWVHFVGPVLAALGREDVTGEIADAVARDVSERRRLAAVDGQALWVVEKRCERRLDTVLD